MSAAVLADTSPTETTADDDSHYTHIVYTPGRDTEAILLKARIDGTPVEALCGFVWVPQRDPKKHPLCEACLEATNIMPA